MTIKNKTRDTILAQNVIEAKSLKDQTIGLLKYKNPTALLIKTNFGIHTFFMNYAIDVLVLDRANTVVAIKEDLKPNTVFFWNPKYGTILELPSGTIAKTRTVINDKITLL